MLLSSFFVAKNLIRNNKYRVLYERLMESKPILKGDSVQCACCGYSFDSFFTYKAERKVALYTSNIKLQKFIKILLPHLSKPVYKLENEVCPVCSSLGQHRHLFYYLNELSAEYNGEANDVKLLHFAPEQFMKDFFLSVRNINYYDCDLFRRDTLYIENITKLSFQDNFFDIIICSHVLEHIIDDIAAMRELLRVLKPNGVAFLMIPYNLERTIEDPQASTAQKRLAIYNQTDHVREYSSDDFVNRLNKIGFTVNISSVNIINQSIVDRFRLRDSIFICTKES